ncbi:hypothetical protein BFJ72_g2943 [Fusarium proliferatum]|uniref:DUF7918 domain-containing protein n=1 Tax=Gibberella intermedia TaxID=948311 RepID=A0A420TXI8_GIBIN|nr:hypothetical protein BFJ72_g2943 [Fusarium proliferatum]
MAVLDEVPHVTARVRVAGELATEYDPLDDEEAVVKLDKEGTKIPRKVCYIESKSGAEFAIEIVVSDKYQPPNSHDSFIAEVYVDGERRRCKILDVPLSSKALQHEMIIPRTPSPEPSATTSIDASALSLLTESDIRRLALERLRDTQIKNEPSHVKREAEEASQSPRRWKFVRLDDGKEAVDLTDD